MHYISGILEIEHTQFDGFVEIYPPPEKVFNALLPFKPEDCRVIIIGQDPYVLVKFKVDFLFQCPKE